MRDATALASPAFEVRQFHTQHGALHAFHAIIEADFVVIIAAGRTVLAQRAGPRGESGVVGDQRAAFAVSSEVLSGIKTKAGDGAESPNVFAFVFGGMRLARVFQ